MGARAALLLPVSASDGPSVSGRLGGASPLAHCLQAVCSSDLPVDPVVVAVSQDLVPDVEASLAAHGRLAGVAVVPVPGPATRVACLRVAVAELDRVSPPPTHVLVHDIRRPLASAELCGRVIEALMVGHAAVVPALTMVDSVKAVDEMGMVRETVDRASLRAAQFPRGFALKFLREALAAEEGDALDEITYAVERGQSLELVAGEPDAFPIDRPSDAALAEAILSCRLAGHR